MSISKQFPKGSQNNLNIRTARLDDREKLTQLIKDAPFFYRHLDWVSPLEWLGQQPFYLVEKDLDILAALACPPEPQNVYWLRLFVISSSIKPDKAFQTLFSELKRNPLLNMGSHLNILAIQEWLEQIVISNNFHLHQSITVLKWHVSNQELKHKTNKINIRNMQPSDLVEICNIDNLAFDDIWQLSREALIQAYAKSSYSSVVLHEEKVVGYQMSTATDDHAHLARLAILPEFQGRSYGSTLVDDMLANFRSLGINEITVNTQSDNFASLSLYKKIGFSPTGEEFPIFRYSF